MTRPYPPRRSKAAFTDDEIRAVAAQLKPASSANAWFVALTAELHRLKPYAALTLATVQTRCARANPPIRTYHVFLPHPPEKAA